MRILIADDHPLYLDAVQQRTARLFPEADIQVACTAAELCRLLRQESADLVITDYSMPDTDGIANIQKIIECAKGTPVIVMSGVPSEVNVQACLGIGAKGFLPKTLSAEVFAAAVSLIASGGTYVPPEVLLNAEAEVPDNAFNLSERELEILQMIVDGAANKEIARAFEIEEVTVKFHLSRIFKKMGVKNRSQAAVAAVRNGVVS